MSAAVERRIGALKPGIYTRIGAAVRHAAPALAGPAAAHELLIVLTDGKPNDIDHYEGRFAVEDTRKAVQEARRLGAGVFGVTIDAAAQAYFPTLFGRAATRSSATSAACQRPCRRYTGSSRSRFSNCSKEELARRVVCASANSRLCPSAYVARDQDRPLAIQITKRPDRRDQVRGDWINSRKVRR